MRAKPWPQKGTGRARHKSKYGPQWKGGYKPYGPKGPTSFFYVLPKEKRVEGLCTALTVKLHQAYSNEYIYLNIQSIFFLE